MTTSDDESYTVLITFHSAQNVPIADLHNLSADPYVLASVVAPSRPREPHDPKLLWRTPTVHCSRDPVWVDTWVVSGLPKDGFLLEMKIVDEDTNDRDDRLGKAEASFSREMMHEGFEVKERAFKVQKRRGSIIPYIMTYAASILPGQSLRKHNRIVISAKVLEKATHPNDRRVYTVGPNAYTQHFSPLIGSMPVSASSYVANQVQLTGPTPKELRHHYVGYNFFIKWLYGQRGFTGKFLHGTLRKQYRALYSHDKNTLYGVVDTADSNAPQADADTSPDKNSIEHSAVRHRAPGIGPRAFAQQFLSLTKFGTGGRLYTYVLTLDAQWRFCETGDEFAIDFLSKHMMHADGAQIIAYAGEFFVRRIFTEGGEGDESASTDGEVDDEPAHYELVIDNDSGTYRPPEATLPILQGWLSENCRLGALGRVIAMHCMDDKLQEMKHERKELKKRLAGGELPKRQVAKRSGSSASSLRVDGQKMSSREVERVVAEAQKDNEEKMHEGPKITNGDAQGAASKPGGSKTPDSREHTTEH
ncbi:hypothetical protein DFH11DRAFT_1508846 [Phellopilus nigrolimitatus]|nr:hypothetical protein DFH11DRAFT_1508846 [Phellopilus nigrolimitatus]